MNEKEVFQIRRFKLALIHLGGISGHVVHKAKSFLRYVDIPAIVVCEPLLTTRTLQRSA